MTSTNYQQQATDFLKVTNTTFKATFKINGIYFADDKATRDIYSITLKNTAHKFTFKFGQSYNNSNYGKTPPTAYDVLSCLTKYDVGTFDDFCSDFGYDTDSRKAYKVYKAVLREWKNIKILFNSSQIELLQNIS
jgi:cytochrome c oxidase assembly protein Cox11